MDHSLPQMHINMPLITSELFFSSDGGDVAIQPSESLSERETQNDHNTSSFPFATDEECGSAQQVCDEAEDAEGELFVDLSRELAAIEGAETLSVLQSESAGDAPKQEISHSAFHYGKAQTVLRGMEASAAKQTGQHTSELVFSPNRHWEGHLQQVGHICSTVDIRMKDRYQQQHFGLLSRDFHEAAFRCRFVGDSSTRPSPTLHASLGDEPSASLDRWPPSGEGKDGAANDSDNQTDSDLASLLGSVEQARRRIKLQDESESRVDAALYAGGVVHFSRSAASTAGLLPQNATEKSRKHISRAISGPLRQPTSGKEAEEAGTNAANCEGAAASRESPAALSALADSSYNRVAACEASMRPIQQKDKDQGGFAKRGSEGEPGFSQESKNKPMHGVDVTAEMKRNALLSAAVADLKEELGSLKEELVKARSAAHLSSKAIYKLREWRELEAASGKIVENLSEEQLSPAEQCLQELEAIFCKGDQDGLQHAKEIELLQQELSACKEAKRLAELRGESLRNEISFLQLVNGKMAEKREADHSSALETLKQHVEEKTQEVKKVQEEKEMLRRELDHLKSHCAEELAAADAAKATIQHELNATKHVSALKTQEMEEAMERLRNENQQLRKQKEVAESRLRNCAQAERLAQLEREDMQEKQARLAKQHEALRKSLKEIRSSAAKARRKWLDSNPHTAGEKMSSPRDSDWVARETSDFSLPSLSSLSNVASVDREVAGTPQSPFGPRAFQPSDSYGRALSSVGSTDGIKVDTKTAPGKAPLKAQKKTDEGKVGDGAGGVQVSESDRLRYFKALGQPPFPSHSAHLQENNLKEKGMEIKSHSLKAGGGGGKETTFGHCSDFSAVTESADSLPSCQTEHKKDEKAPTATALVTELGSVAKYSEFCDPQLGRSISNKGRPALFVFKYQVPEQKRDPAWAAGKALKAVSPLQPQEGLRGPSLQPQRSLHLVTSNPRVPAEGHGSKSEAGAPKAIVLPPTPGIDLSAELQANASFALPSSVSADIEVTKEEELNSATRLYTRKLQELEETNEILRRTNALADKENASLKQMLEGLMVSPCTESGTPSPMEALRLSEVLSPIDLRSPPLKGGETARSSLSPDEIQQPLAGLRKDAVPKKSPVSRERRTERGGAFTSEAPRSLKNGQRECQHVHEGGSLSIASIQNASYIVTCHLDAATQTPRTIQSLLKHQGQGAMLPPPKKKRKRRANSCHSDASEESPSSCNYPQTSPKTTIHERKEVTLNTDNENFDCPPVSLSDRDKQQTNGGDTACCPVALVAGEDLLQQQNFNEPDAPPPTEVLSSNSAALLKAGTLSSGCSQLHRRENDGEEIFIAPVATSRNETQKATPHFGIPKHLAECKSPHYLGCLLTQEPAAVPSHPSLEDFRGPIGANASAATGDQVADAIQKAQMVTLIALEEQNPKYAVCAEEKSSPLASPKVHKKADGRLVSVETRAPTPRSARFAEARETPRSCVNFKGNGELLEYIIDNTSFADGDNDATVEYGGDATSSQQRSLCASAEGLGSNPFPNTDEAVQRAIVHSIPGLDRETLSPVVALQETSLQPVMPASILEKCPQLERICSSFPSQPSTKAEAAHVQPDPERCTMTLSDSASSIALARQIVAEVGQSFKIKFLQHKKKASLSTDLPEATNGCDSSLLTPNLEMKLVRTPPPQRKQKAEVCLMSSNLVFSRSSNGSSWNLPSSRKCEACIAAACDRMFADASPTAVTGLRKLASPRRGALGEDPAYRILAELSPSATAVIRKLVSSTKRGALGDDVAAKLGLGSPKALKTNKNNREQRREKEGGEPTTSLVGTKAEKKPYVPAGSPVEIQHKTDISETLKSRKPRSSSTSRAVQAKRSFATPSPNRQRALSKASSPVRAVFSGNDQSSSRGRIKQASVAVKRQKSQGHGPSCHEKLTELVKATARHPGSSTETKGSPPLLKAPTKAAAGVVEKMTTPAPSNSKPGLRSQKAMQLSKADSTGLRSVSPSRQERTRPASVCRGRYPGARPPWDFSSAPRQGGPRIPFKSLPRKEQVIDR